MIQQMAMSTNRMIGPPRQGIASFEASNKVS